MDFDLGEITDFDWDEGNLKHISTHNVDHKECEEALLNGIPIITEDVSHSQNEQRYRIYGKTNSERSLFIIITIRDKKIRVISARDQNKKERKEYQKVNNI